MIVNREDHEKPKYITIDLNGPEGNVFNLISLATNLGKRNGWSQSKINMLKEEMMSSDYNNAVSTLETFFSDEVLIVK